MRKDWKFILFIVLIVLFAAGLTLFTVFALVPKMGVLAASVVVLSLLPFISAVFIAKKPAK